MKGNYQHGMCNSPTWRSWQQMKSRCLMPGATGYAFYGGRGIAVCDRWIAFPNFLADMGERPEGTTLDRIDSNGHYTPNNCRWATKAEQSSNRRSARMIEIGGKLVSMTSAAREAGMRPATLWKRLKDGWSVDRALAEPVRGRK